MTAAPGFAKASAALALACAATGAWLLLSRGDAAPRPVRDDWTAMGTVAGVTFRDASCRDGVRETVQAVFARHETLLSAWDPASELCRLSRGDGTNWIARVSPEVAPCYRAALALRAATGGAFDPDIGARMRAQGFAGRKADFDLGAIAKGFSVDAAYDAVTNRFGARDLLIDLGGNLRAVGGAWRTGVRDPFGRGFAATFTLAPGEAVATSGNYERFVTRADGRRISHILDPRTGEPAAGVAGVTVVAPSAMLADGLSTALFVLGPARGADFLRRHHPGAAALWIPDTPDAPRLIATAALAARLADLKWPLDSLAR